MTVLSTFYFVVIRQDGTVFATVATLIAGVSGYHVGKAANGRVD